jgi:hypothetical protein
MNFAGDCDEVLKTSFSKGELIGLGGGGDGGLCKTKTFFASINQIF